MLIVLVIAASAVLLTVGISTGQSLLVWYALGTSVVSAAFLGVLAVRARRNAGMGTGLSDKSESAPGPGSEIYRGTPGAVEGGRDGGPTDLTVHVLHGRGRYHMEGCRLLVAKPSEEISLGDATDEGFTACTVCMPRSEMVACEGLST
jgi:hypothetical protein